MLCIGVALMSGRTAWVSLDPDCTVQELRRQAQLELGVPLDRLFKSIGDSTRAPALQALPNTRTLNKAGLHDGQVLTGSVRETKIASYLGSCGSPVRSFTLEDLYSPFDALAIEWEDGSIRICSNDPFPASDSMCGVQHVTASSRAFAAIQEDGRVTAFGDPDAGGDVKFVQDQLEEAGTGTNSGKLCSVSPSFLHCCASGADDQLYTSCVCCPSQ